MTEIGEVGESGDSRISAMCHIEITSEVAARNPLGKGEVHSSILCGSTTKPYKISPFPRRSPAFDVAIAQNEARNAQVDPWKIRGLCSVDVRTEARP